MTEKLSEVSIQVLTHRDSGLKMALSPELPGFVVHANSSDELDNKIPAALRSFMKYTRGDDSEWRVISEETPAGFDPICYIARSNTVTSRAA